MIMIIIELSVQNPAVALVDVDDDVALIGVIIANPIKLCRIKECIYFKVQLFLKYALKLTITVYSVMVKSN